METAKTMIMQFGKHEGKRLNWVHKHDPSHLRELLNHQIPFPGLKAAILTCFADDILEREPGPNTGFKSWRRK